MLILLISFSLKVYAESHLEEEPTFGDPNTQFQSQFETNPTAANLLRIENPTLDQFNQLDFSQQATYLQQNYNNEFAIDFFKDSANVGRNPSVDTLYFEKSENIGVNQQSDDAFFSGSYAANPAQASRDNINKIIGFSQPNSVSKYFSDKYGAPYSIDSIAENFQFDIENGKLTNGAATINFELFKDDSTITSITTTTINSEGSGENGIVIKRNEQEISLLGENDLELTSFIGDEVTGEAFFVVSRNNNPFTISSGESLSISSSSSSTTINGRFTGTVNLNGEDINFNTDSGISFGDDGSWATRNAEISTELVYVKGKSARSFENNKFEYLLRDTGMSNENGPIRTVFVDKVGGIAAISQGSPVYVHHDAVNPSSAYAPKKLQSQDVQRIAQQALAEAKTQPNRADVWIKNSGPSTMVYAQGRVKLQHYNVEHGLVLGPNTAKAQFTGKNNLAVFDYAEDGTREFFNMRGLGIYQDSQVTAEGEINQAVISKRGAFSNGFNDVLEVSCIGCQDQDLIARIEKNVLVTTREGTGAPGEVGISETSASIGFTFSAQDGKVIASFDKYSLQNIAKIGLQADLQPGTNIADASINFDKALYIKAEGNENYLGIGTDGVGRYEVLNAQPDGTFVTKAVGIDFNFPSIIGEKIIVTTPEQQQQVDRMVTALENGDFNTLRQIKSTDIQDPGVREFIQRKFGIDATQLDSVDYTNKIVSKLQAQKRAEEIAQQVYSQYGVQIDVYGQCLSNCDRYQEAFQDDDVLARRVFDLNRQNALSAVSDLEAQRLAALQQGKSVELIDRQLTDARRAYGVWNEAYGAVVTKIRYDQAGEFVQKAATDSFSDEERQVLNDADNLGTRRRTLNREITKEKQKIAYLEEKADREEQQGFENQVLISQQKRVASERLREWQKKLSSLNQRLTEVKLEAERVSDGDAGFVSLALSQADDRDASLKLARDVGEFNPDAANFLIARNCALAGDVACSRKAADAITEDALQAAADSLVKKEEINQARKRYTRAQDQYEDAKFKAQEFEIQRQERVLPSALYFWDDTDRDNENLAISSSKALRDAHYASLVLQEQGDFSPEEVFAMNVNEVRVNLNSVIVDAGGTVTDQNIGAWGVYKGTHLTAQVADYGGELTDQQRFDLSMQEAQALINLNHLDESAAEANYLDIVAQFQDTDADVSSAQAALARIEDDKILGLSSQQRGRFASEAIDVLAVADVAAGTIAYGAKAVILAGKAARAERLIRVGQAIERAGSTPIVFTNAGRFNRLITNEAKIAAKAQQYGARTGQELADRVLAAEGGAGIRELDNLGFHPDNALFQTFDNVQSSNLASAAARLEQADAIVDDVVVNNAPATTELRVAVDNYQAASSSSRSIDEVFDTADTVILERQRLNAITRELNIPESRGLGSSPAPEGFADNLVDDVIPETHISDTFVRTPSGNLQSTSGQIITRVERAPSPQLARARSATNELGIVDSGEFSAISRTDPTVNSRTTLSSVSRGDDISDLRLVDDSEFSEVLDELSEATLEITNDQIIVTRNLPPPIPEGSVDDIVRTPRPRNEDVIVPDYRPSSLEELAAGDVSPAQVRYISDTYGVNYQYLRAEGSGISEEARKFLEDNGFNGLVARHNPDAQIAAKRYDSSLQNNFLERNPEQYKIINDLDLWQASAFQANDGEWYFLKIGATEDFFGYSPIGITDSVRRNRATANILRNEFTGGEAIPDLLSVNIGNNIEIVVSPALSGYSSLTKGQSFEFFGRYVSQNALEPDEIVRLSSEIDEMAVFNTGLRLSDVELGIARVDGTLHVTSIDNEAAFAGYRMPDIGDRINDYDVVAELFANRGAIGAWKPSGNDFIFTGVRREQFYDAAGNFDELLFQSRFREHINRFNEFINSERFPQYLRQTGYNDQEINSIVSQTRARNVESDLRQAIETDGRAVVRSDGRLMSEDDFIAENRPSVASEVAEQIGEVRPVEAVQPPPLPVRGTSAERPPPLPAPAGQAIGFDLDLVDNNLIAVAAE